MAPHDKPSRAHLSWLKPFVFTALVCLAISSLSRVLLAAWLHERLAVTGGIGFVLLQGVRFDLVMLGVLLAVPMALTPILSAVRPLHGPWFRFLRVYLAIVIGLWVFLEAATPPFILEYDVRPNLLFVEYLKYPKEVLSMLFVGYKLELVAGLIVVPAVVWPAYRKLASLSREVSPSVGWSAVPLAFLALISCTAAVRSTLDHRPVNPSTVAFSSDTLVNTLPLSSLYSVTYAIYELRHEDEGFPYGEVDADLSIDAERAAMAVQPELFTDEDIPTLHFQAATAHPDKPLNLVIIIEESLGAEFVGSMGGLPLTPNLDRWADRGIWFEQLFATGTRSARGLEAIVTGFPPTTSQSVLKLGKAQQDFFTLAAFLREQGYDTSFIYGGEAQFDNMKRFFANNGFETVIDKHDFVDPVFYGSWGASDEDVFSNAHEKFLQQSPDQPFFSVLFTTSNHSPWEYPDGRIDPYDEEKATVNNAVKYADFALGQYLDTASQAPYWENTVFLVVSDHNSRVAGAELVPIERFHIPGLIVGGSIEPLRVERMVSQIDLLPTMLSLIGVSGSHPAPGIDLTRPDLDEIPERAIMQYADVQAYREGDRVVVLRKGLEPQVYDYRDGAYSPAENDPEIIRKAIALAAWPVRAYRDKQYQLPVD
jgi:phosphoglycerol transferase MdoB-like AlkP superfamily enzyme